MAREGGRSAAPPPLPLPPLGSNRVNIFEIEFFYFFLSERVTKISIKTGDVPAAQTEAVADLQICDHLGNCCQTEELNNYGDDRQKGATDEYTNYLGNCSEVRNIHLVFGIC